MRKQLAVKILKSSFDKLEKIKEETGLSNAKIIEMLLENYDNTNTNVNTNASDNTNINTSITEERVAEMIQEALANINISANTNINTSTNTNISDLPEGYVPYRYDDTEDISEEERAEIAATCEWVDETPEWQQKQLEEQAKPTIIPEPVIDNTPMTKEELERFYKEEDERKQKLAEERKKTRGTSKYR
jgi:hypothetical protein